MEINNLTKSLAKINFLKKINIFSKLNFNAARKAIIEKIKTVKIEDKKAERAIKIVGLSRKEERPKSIDYINGIFDDFIELSGDRLSGNNNAIIAGLGSLGSITCAVLGYNKGKDLKERIEYNFGMPDPSGYRKSKRIMEIANRFKFPVITFVDTPGANPAIEAEDSGQASAIAYNIEYMFKLEVPVIVVLIGEGGSGGALALSIGNYIMMLENSTYSVISPEGCAAILWKDQAAVKEAASALKLTASDLFSMGIIDRIIKEPIGGAHNNSERTIYIVKKHILKKLYELININGAELKKARAEKFEKIGFYKNV